MFKSFTLNTLTVAKLWSVGFGLGWIFVILVANIGWGCAWAGMICLCWCSWDGHYTGWVGVIRGERVEKPFRFSGCPLVVCLYLFVWSLGIFTVSPRSLCLRWLFRGLLRSVFCHMSGIDSYPGDIRKDQLGGSSFRCFPICSLTPMLETAIGCRNLCYFIFYNHIMGLGCIKGWGRWLAVIKWWLDIRFSYSEGFAGKLDWAVIIYLMLLYLSSYVVNIMDAIFWLHHIGRIQRKKYWYFLSGRPRGNLVIQGWVCVDSPLVKLGWKYQIWHYVLLANQSGFARVLQCKQSCADKAVTVLWSRAVCCGISVLWKHFMMGDKCRQPSFCHWVQKMVIKQVLSMVWSRGMFVLLGWIIYYQDSRLFFCEFINLWGKLSDFHEKSDLLIGFPGLLYVPQGLIYYAQSFVYGLLGLMLWQLYSLSYDQVIVIFTVHKCVMLGQGILHWELCLLWYKYSLPINYFGYRGRCKAAGKIAVVLQGCFCHFSGFYMVLSLFREPGMLGRFSVYCKEFRGYGVSYINCVGCDIKHLLDLCVCLQVLYKVHVCRKGSILLYDLLVPRFGHQGLVVRGLVLFYDSLVLAMWYGDMWQLNSYENGLGHLIHLILAIHQVAIGSGFGLYMLVVFWANRSWRIMLRDGPFQPGLLVAILKKSQSMGVGMMYHEVKAWAAIKWALLTLGCGTQKMSFFDRVWGSVRKYGRSQFVCGLDSYNSVYSIPCYARFFCIPSVGSMVSYFWSPKPVSGDVTGGMPLLKV
ncbi:hypothetical protein HanHA300_Chr11g0383101 [Helianthus annuus]|nr:hypothetical protein HanHA300_Chr11g0383101 [Helianthus annuus]KAJ0683686.1 hypothetical protein HanLR1_Chr11g0383101 [Helianthus annuus]